MCPALIIAGSDDRTVGNDAAFELNRGISGSELYIYDGLGHGALSFSLDFLPRVEYNKSQLEAANQLLAP